MGALLHTYPKAIIVNKIVDFLYGNQPRLVVTPNPEMLLLARKDPELADILAHPDIGVCDGIGLVRILQMKGVYGVERITGVDLVHDIVRVASEHSKSIMLVGAGPGVAALARLALLEKYPDADIHSYVGPNVSYKVHNAHPYAENDEEVLHEIESFKPAVLILALGAGKQEKWLHAYRDRLPFVKVMIGVGGALDMISGMLPRAPRFIRAIGLEWLWRLLLQPWRAFRILKAVIVFPFVALREKVYFPNGDVY